MKQPGKYPWKGKVTGGIFGILAGPFGIFLGFLIGHLIDLIIEAASVRRLTASFITDPAGSPLAAWEGGMYSYFSLGAAAFTANGGRAKLREKGLFNRLGEYYPLRDDDYKYLQEIIENIDALDREFNLPAHARVVLGGAARDKLDYLFQGLVAFASVDGTADLRTSAVEVLRGIAAHWGIDPGNFGGLKAERSAEEDAWEILGLKPGAPADEVKRVFRILASQFHPDGASALSEVQRRETEEAFKRIRLAYNECMGSLTRSAG